MILFFESGSGNLIAVGTSTGLPDNDREKLKWLFGDARLVDQNSVNGTFVGPRKEMITPWSTNAVEITQNMGISGITRIEEFFASGTTDPEFDPMLQAVYNNPGQDIFTTERVP
jgi:phosphoribosylformylglycinamidine synthase